MAFFYPVVGETFDGVLNNINGFKIKEEHAPCCSRKCSRRPGGGR